ncbi:MAG: hypothetical protein ACI8WB_004330 [Phenylobacterium sp.]|jgi:hypothetical protein
MSGLNILRGQFWLRTCACVLSFYLSSLILGWLFLSFIFVSSDARAGQVTVNLIDAQSHQSLGSTEITAYHLKPDGSRDWYSRTSTDDAGQLVFDLENIENGESYILGTKVYNNYRILSEPLTQLTSYDFVIGKVRMTLQNGSEDGLPAFANQKITIKKINDEGDYEWFGNATTDQNGQLRLNLPNISSDQPYVISAKSAVSGARKYSEELTGGGDTAFVVGGKALAVTLIDAKTNSPIGGQKVTAYEVDDANVRHWHTSNHSDDNGVVLFDLTDLGKGTRYALGAKVYNNFTVFSQVFSQPGTSEMRFGTNRISLLDGTVSGQPALTDHKVTVYQRGSDGDKTWFSSVYSDPQGMLNIDLPDIDSGQRYVLGAKSPVSGQIKYSEDLSHTGEQQFVVGNSPLAVTLVDGRSGAAIPLQRVDVYQLDSENQSQWHTRGETDSEGKVNFDLVGLGSGTVYMLRSKVFNNHASYSSLLSSTSPLTFKVGQNLVNVTNATVSPAQPLAEHKISFYETQSDGSLAHFTSAYSDSNGQVRIDLPGLDKGKVYISKAKSPADARSYYNKAVSTTGITELMVGSMPLTVKLTDAISTQVLADKRIDAYQIQADGKRAWFSKKTTDANGMVVFDLPGMGSEASGGQPYQLAVRGFDDFKSYSNILTAAGELDFSVGAVAVQLLNGSAPGKPALPDTRLSVMTVENGKNVWFASATSDGNGRVRLDLPGINSGVVYRFKAPSPVNDTDKYSGLITQVGNIDFVAGNPAVEVTLSNVLNGVVYPEHRITAYHINQSGGHDSYGRITTDANGSARFDLDGIALGQSYYFKTSKFDSGSSYSQVISSVLDVDFAIGAVPITLLDKDNNQVMADVKITAYQIKNDGQLQWLKSGHTNTVGQLTFDLQGLGEGQRFVFKASNPFNEGKRYYGPIITGMGALIFNLKQGEYGDLDLTAPEISIDSPDSNIANANGFTVSGIASDNQAIEHIQVMVIDTLLGRHEVEASFDQVSQRWQADILAEWVSEGEEATIVASAFDFSLNNSSSSRAYLISADVADPVIEITSHQPQDLVNVVGFTVLGTVSDDIGVESITATLSDPLLGETISNQPLNIGINSGQWAFSVTNGKVSPDQLVTVTLLATDINGKTSVETLQLSALSTSTNPVQLAQRITFGLTPELLIRIKRGDDILAEQLAPDTIDDAAFEAQMAAMDVTDGLGLRTYLLRYMTGSKKQLREVMAWFWENHFNTNINTHGNAQYELRENNLFRQHALGNFRDLLASSAKSPAMIHYLNNAQNVSGRANENYAREVMELHTMGVDGGYSATDIAELSRIFTGWHESEGQFAFNDDLHDMGDKTFLGNAVMGSGVAEGEQVLDILSNHSATAGFICSKLVTLFVSDQAVNGLVQQCAAEFLQSEGDITAVLRVIFASEAFVATENTRNKVKTPIELMTSLARGFNAHIEYGDMTDALKEMGMRLFEFPAPTGFSEVAEDWLNSNAVLQRMRLANQVAWHDSNAFRVDFRQLLLNQGYSSAEAVVSFLFELALANDFSALEYQIALDILNQDSGFDISANEADDKLSRLLGTVLSFPGFQYQ